MLYSIVQESYCTVDRMTYVQSSRFKDCSATYNVFMFRNGYVWAVLTVTGGTRSLVEQARRAVSIAHFE
jgi:hypothetical protein